MKSERRHELQHNELADWLEQKFQAIKPYTNAILGVVILVLAVSAILAWQARSSAERAGNAWDGIATAMDDQNAADLDELSETYAGSASGEWAALIAGDMHLEAGCKVLLDNRDNARQELEDAVAAYNKVVGSSTPILRQWAKYGLARAMDAQCTFDPKANADKAIAAYQDVVDDDPEGGYAKAAQRRIDDLRNPTTLALYRKINKHEPAGSGSGIDNPFPNTPGFDLDSLRETERPDEGLPGFNPLMKFDDAPAGQEADTTSQPDEAATPDAATTDAPAAPAADESTEETGQPE